MDLGIGGETTTLELKLKRGKCLQINSVLHIGAAVDLSRRHR